MYFRGLVAQSVSLLCIRIRVVLTIPGSSLNLTHYLYALVSCLLVLRKGTLPNETGKIG